MKKKEKQQAVTFPYLVFVFLICCVAGWIFEVLIEFSWGNGFVNRGFLYGPYLPVYGVGGLVCMAVLLKMVRAKPFGSIGTPIVAFLAFAVITSVLELVTAIAMKAIFHLQMWDYSEHWMNYKGMVSPFAAFRFAIGGMILLYLVCPMTDRLCKGIPERAQRMAAICICAVMGLDTVITLIVRSQAG